MGDFDLSSIAGFYPDAANTIDKIANILHIDPIVFLLGVAVLIYSASKLNYVRKNWEPVKQARGDGMTRPMTRMINIALVLFLLLNIDEVITHLAYVVPPWNRTYRIGNGFEVFLALTILGFIFWAYTTMASRAMHLKYKTSLPRRLSQLTKKINERRVYLLELIGIPIAYLLPWTTVLHMAASALRR